MTKLLQVAEDRTLPVEILQDSTTIFGRKRTGKSNNAVVIVEEALDLHAQTVIVDPKGDWWGITSSFDGKAAGYPVVVIGGRHATLELNPYAGETVAEWVLETGYSVIIDLSLLKDPERNRFCAAFLETLRRRKTEKPGPILLVIDEADELAPEDQRDRLHVIDAYRLVVWMVKRGGFAGIGTVCITQRPAAISKNVTTQSETVVVLQVSGSQDLDAVSDALKHHVPGVTKKERTAALEDLLREIVQLDKGSTVIVSAAAHLKGKIHRIQFRRRRTFDSGATPKFGQQVRAPKVVAKVAIEQLSAAMQKAVAEQKAKDPAELHKAIASLRKELEGERKKQPAPAKTETKIETRYVLRDGQLARAEKLFERGYELLARIQGDLRHEVVSLEEKSKAFTEDIRAVIDPLTRAVTSVRSAPPPSVASARSIAGSTGGGAVRAAAVPSPSDRKVDGGETRPTLGVAGRPSADRAAAAAARATEGEPRLTPSARKLLAAVLWRERIVGETQTSRTTAAALAGVSTKSSTASVEFGRLAAAGYVEVAGDGLIRLTDTGRGRADLNAIPSTKEELWADLERKMTPSAQRMFRVLTEIYPDDISRTELAERAEVSTVSSTSSVELGKMANLGAVEITGKARVRASAVIFMEQAS